MGGDSPPPPNSRFRKAQRKFAGQNYCLSKAVQGTQRDPVSFDVGEFECCPKIFRGYYGDTRMRSHRLFRLNENKSAASHQQA